MVIFIIILAGKWYGHSINAAVLMTWAGTVTDKCHQIHHPSLALYVRMTNNWIYEIIYETICDMNYENSYATQVLYPHFATNTQISVLDTLNMFNGLSKRYKFVSI